MQRVGEVPDQDTTLADIEVPAQVTEVRHSAHTTSGLMRAQATNCPPGTHPNSTNEPTATVTLRSAL